MNFQQHVFQTISAATIYSSEGLALLLSEGQPITEWRVRQCHMRLDVVLTILDLETVEGTIPLEHEVMPVIKLV